MRRSRRYRTLPSAEHREFFVACLLTADPFGNLLVDAEHVGAMLIPRRELTDDECAAWLAPFYAADMLRPYTVDGNQYAHLPRYRQRLRYAEAKLPRPPVDKEDPWIQHAIDNKQLSVKDRTQPGSVPDATSLRPGSNPANARARIATAAPPVHRPDVDVDVDVEKNRARENPATPAPIAAALAPLLKRIEKAKDQAKANQSATAATTAADAPPKDPAQSSASWWASQAGIEAKALELAMPANPGERWPDWVARLRQADADRRSKPRKGAATAHQAPPAT
jgi:hypothetical protein